MRYKDFNGSLVTSLAAPHKFSIDKGRAIKSPDGVMTIKERESYNYRPKHLLNAPMG